MEFNSFLGLQQIRPVGRLREARLNGLKGEAVDLKSEVALRGPSTGHASPQLSETGLRELVNAGSRLRLRAWL